MTVLSLSYAGYRLGMHPAGQKARNLAECGNRCEAVQSGTIRGRNHP